MKYWRDSVKRDVCGSVALALIFNLSDRLEEEKIQSLRTVGPLNHGAHLVTLIN